MNRLSFFWWVCAGCLLLGSSCSRALPETTIQLEEINCELTQQERRDILRMVEYEYAFYHSFFTEKNPLLQVKLFGDSTEYRNYQKQISNSDATNGFYSQSQNVAVINKNKRFLKTIFHELNHFILRQYLPEVPKWLNEGLSEYFEYAVVEGDKVKIMPQPKKVKRLKKWTGEQGEIRLTDFLNWSNQEWRDANIKPDFYSSTLSWGLLYFFMEEAQRRNILTKIIVGIRGGKDALTAIEEHYVGGSEKLQNDFMNFVDTSL